MVYRMTQKRKAEQALRIIYAENVPKLTYEERIKVTEGLDYKYSESIRDDLDTPYEPSNLVHFYCQYTNSKCPMKKNQMHKYCPYVVAICEV